MTKKLTLCLCATDWRYELGEAADGTTFYPSLDALKHYRQCWSECGVIRVDVAFDNAEMVVPENFGGEGAK